MTARDALLAAIAANPDDDLPRLVFADWLEENGNSERAEFIRVECESARTDRTSPDYPTLLRRADRLLAAHSARWFGPLADESVAERILTRRGFVDTLVLTAERFVAHADAIRTQAPMLHGLHVTAADDWRAFFHSPSLPDVRTLSFEEELFTPEAAEELARSKGVWTITELDLDRQPLGPDGAGSLGAARLPRLEKLSIAGCGLGNEGVRMLLTGCYQHIRDLDFSENELTDASCHAIAATTNFTRIEKLALCENHITGAGVSALAAAPHLDQLKSLNLYSNPIGPEGGRAIAVSRYWGKLSEMNLVNCGIGMSVANELRWVYGDKALKV